MIMLIVIAATLALVAVLAMLHGYEAAGLKSARFLWLAVPPACVALLKPEPIAWIPAVALVSVVAHAWIAQRVTHMLGMLLTDVMTAFRCAPSPLSHSALVESTGRSAPMVLLAVHYLERYQVVEHDRALVAATPLGKLWHTPLFRLRHAHGSGCTCSRGAPA